MFPENIKQQLKGLNIPKKNRTSILTDNKGIILECKLGENNLFISKPFKGALIDDFFSGANAYLNKGNNIYLPNIQTLPLTYADLYIFGNKEEKTTWFIFINVSERVIKEKETIKNYNTEHLHEDKSNKSIINLAFLKIGGLLLKHIYDNNFKIISDIPIWFYDIVSLPKADNTIDISVVFPFLETFFLFFLSEKDSGTEYLRSGSWLQQTLNNKEITLQSLGMHHSGENYIIIIPDELNKPESRQELIQKARENVLAYEKLEKQEKKLKELLLFKQSFNAIISHDFRSPIGALSMSLDMLIDDDNFTKNLNEENREILGMMQEQLIALNNYNSKLYAWSQLEKEDFELDKKSIDVKKLFTDISQKFSHQLKNKKLTLEVIIDNNINLIADRVLLNQSLSNLMENAIKFSFEGGEIELKATSEILSIKDSGIGMNKEQQEKLLLEGGKNDSRLGTNGEQGSGLGITIVKKIIESHGFNFSINSEENKGTTFIIELNQS